MEFLPPTRKPAFWPLAGPAADLFVAGRRLRDWQEALAPAGNFAMVENAWIAVEDWRLLVETGEAAKLESHRGEVLAWTGTGGEGEMVVAMASEKSFVVRYPWDLLQVNAQLLDPFAAGSGPPDGFRRVICGEGFVLAGEGTKILPGVFAEGVILIGRDCKIGPNCYLRGATTIGEGCHIGQAVEVKNSILGARTSVGHLSYVGDSILGERVNFGAGTTTSNLRHDGGNHRSMVSGELVETGRRKFGTVAGDAVHTGIHTALYPGRKLGPATTTLPGEIVMRDKH